MLEYNINLEGKRVLVTGAAGFIGSNLVLRLLRQVADIEVVGLDSVNDYYDVHLKEWRLRQIDALAALKAGERGIEQGAVWRFVKGNLADKPLIDSLFASEHFDVVVNLAAQAGVRYSIDNPGAYIESNIIGFYNILEACRHSCDEVGAATASGANAAAGAAATAAGAANAASGAAATSGAYRGVRHLVYASSSSVYGGNTKVPFSEEDKVDNPVSLYAATKKSNELLAHAYSKLYGIPSTGLRFFTVYGPAGRPDMAYFGFTDKLIKGDTIKIFNWGNCKRDFTYVDDIVEGIFRVMRKAPDVQTGADGLPVPPHKVYNIGNSNPENLLDFVRILKEELVGAGVLPTDFDLEAHRQLVPMQPGDVSVTYADTSALERDFGFRPRTSLREGLRRFAAWYKEFYK